MLNVYFQGKLFMITIAVSIVLFHTSKSYFRMNLIKTDLRNALSTEHLNQLLAISMSQKNVYQFDFNRAAVEFLKSHRNCAEKPRRHHQTSNPNV